MSYSYWCDESGKKHGFRYPIEGVKIDPKTFMPLALVNGVWMTSAQIMKMEIRYDPTCD